MPRVDQMSGFITAKVTLRLSIFHHTFIVFPTPDGRHIAVGIILPSIPLGEECHRLSFGDPLTHQLVEHIFDLLQRNPQACCVILIEGKRDVTFLSDEFAQEDAS
jgi:hypothetical protein